MRYTCRVAAQYSAVTTAGIYCRPGCGARPRADNVKTLDSSGAAEAAGFRACLRCRPYRISGSLPWQAPEFVCRAVQLIIGGALDEGSEADLARQLGMSARHLRRQFQEFLGLTPDQFARSRRSHFARRLLDDTDLDITTVAFASGFGSLRQFNRVMREIFRASPQQLRDRRRRADRLVTDGGLSLRLPFRPPYDWPAAVAFLADRAIPGVESVHELTYRRTVTLDGALGMLEVTAGQGDNLVLTAHLPYWEGVIHVVERISRLLGLEVDVEPAVAHLLHDPIIGPLVARRPGLRPPGVWSAFETGIHAIISQDSSLAEARTKIGELCRRFGDAAPGLGEGLTHLFPAAEVLATQGVHRWGLPETIAHAVEEFSRRIATGQLSLEPRSSLEVFVSELTDIPGIGLSAAHNLALRLGYSAAFPAEDPAIADALRNHREHLRGSLSPTRWRPWRAVAATHLLCDTRQAH